MSKQKKAPPAETGTPKTDIVDQILNDPNTTFRAEDAEELRKLDPEVLQRLMIGMQPPTPSKSEVVSDDIEDSTEDKILSLRDELVECQREIKALVAAEGTIRDELRDYGVSADSIVDQFVAVANQARPAIRPEDLTSEMVMGFVRTSQLPLALCLREGLAARQTNRAKSVEVIVKNSQMYTRPELEHMATADLEKLAGFVMSMRPAAPEQPDFDWVGAGIADQSVGQNALGRSGGTLDLPTIPTTPRSDVF